jgi:hypothetical protein
MHPSLRHGRPPGTSLALPLSGGQRLLALLVLLLLPIAHASARTCPTQYQDRDGDGYGDANLASSRASCKPIPGYVNNHSDCNDYSALIYPGAPEAWWGTADCSLPEPTIGDVLFVNCHLCAPGDPTCDTRKVGCTSPDEACNFPSIQAAIDAAKDGSTVEVCQGIYHERIDFQGKAIAVRGRLTHNVILAGDGSGQPTVVFKNREGLRSQLSRVTITAGIRGEPGGGMYIYNASPMINQVSFVHNSLYERGGALFIQAGLGGTAAPTIRNSSFSQNHARNETVGVGGAVAVLARGVHSLANPSFEDVLFAGNTAFSGGALHVASEAGGMATVQVTRARFFRNSATNAGSAISVEGWAGSGLVSISNTIFERNSTASEPIYLRIQKGNLPVTIVNSTFVGNDATTGLVRGDAGPKEGTLDVTLENSLLVFNRAVDTLATMVARGSGPTATGHYHYNDTYANGYTGQAFPPGTDASHNLAFDPRFQSYSSLGSAMGDLTLSSSSPAINAGNPDVQYNDVNGGRNDLGAYGGPEGDWPALPVPFLTGIHSPDPGIDDMALARRISLELADDAPTSVACDEETIDGLPGESVYFSADTDITPHLDVLGLKADTPYHCFVTASSAGGMGSFGFELFTPPLPLELQGLWKLNTYNDEEARLGYTLFNVFPASFNPHYIVLVDMMGELRWYYAMYDNETSPPYDPDAFTADTAVSFLPETAQVLYGGGMTLGALPQLVPLSPEDPKPLANLACASQGDAIQLECANVPGSDLPLETPNHEALLTVDQKHVMYLCSETLPVEGATPEQYCTDSSYRQLGFSVEEWDISTPDRPVNTWRWSSREQIDRCVLPRLDGTDIYHANALWREEQPDGRTWIYLSLRHRNHILKIDRATGEVAWKLGPLMDEDMCPANTAPDPSQCPDYDPNATSGCMGRLYPRFTLVHDTVDTTCPSDAGYTGPEEKDPQWFYGQHAPFLTRSPSGGKLFYIHDNGRNAPDNIEDPDSRNYTRALHLKVDEAAMTATVDWQYCRGTTPGDPSVWWAPAWGSAYPVQRLDGSLTGHTLVASPHCQMCMRYDDPTSEDTFVAEVSDDKQVVWSLDLGQTWATYRAQRIDGCYRLPGRQDFLMGSGAWCNEPTAGHGTDDPSTTGAEE